jgi:hypothetical protein
MRKLRMAGLVAVVGVVGLTILQWPEIQRYIKMKRM